MRFNFRIILFPFAVVYAMITEIRNFLYDKHILTATSFDVPIINVGNLSVGGTGKTPQIEYLIRLLQKDYKIAVISRGYKRKTKGFIIADETATPEKIGDEPYQIYQKFKEVNVAVDADRVNAIRKVLAKIKPDVILLDDAYQHRRVKAGLNLLLTPFKQPFFKDYILPVGNLRECRHRANRADIVLVTKSTKALSQEQKHAYKQQIKPYTQAPVYFANIAYGTQIVGAQKAISLADLSEYKVLLVTGIANPEPLYSFLSEKNINFESLKFGDHHHFSPRDVNRIKSVFERIKETKKVILTTEKDYVRLQNHFNTDLFYLPIQTNVIENEMFNKKILAYVNHKRRI